MTTFACHTRLTATAYMELVNAVEASAELKLAVRETLLWGTSYLVIEPRGDSVEIFPATCDTISPYLVKLTMEPVERHRHCSLSYAKDAPL